MCKIAMIPGIKEDKAEKAWQFIKKLAPKMSTYDDDGFGYAAFTDDGQLFSERWFVNSEAFEKRDKTSLEDEKLISLLGKDFIEDLPTDKYASTGDISENSMKKTVSIIAHARKATCDKNLQNVHPFIIRGTALIHNGIINNHATMKKEISTCDSEVILTQYLEHKVAKDMKNIKKVAENLRGYYACGILTKLEDRMIMDIFKSSTARLYCAFVKELGTVVFCTSDDMIVNTCKDLGFTCGKIVTIKEDVMFRFDAKTGDMLSRLKFTSKEWEQRSWSYGRENKEEKNETNEEIYDCTSLVEDKKFSGKVLELFSKYREENDESRFNQGI